MVTKREVMAMEGPALNMMVVEHIMKWRLVPDEEYHGLGGAMFAENETGNKQFMWHLEENVYSGELTWTPSTDIVAVNEMETIIETRGLVERYVLALIDVLGLDMQPFGSSVELDWWETPEVEGNSFEQRGSAYLWLLMRATPKERCQAALLAVMQ